MATSGTIATTVFDTIKAIEHAVRRCGLVPSTLTPEQLETATDNLYLILTSIINRGINLWCLDRQLVGLNLNRSRYDLPAGTIDVLHVNYRTGDALAHTGTLSADNYKAVFTSATAIRTVGIYFKQTELCNLVFEASNEGTNWVVIKSLPEFTGSAGQWSWFDIDPAFAVQYFRIRETKADTNILPLQFDQVRLMSLTSSIPMAPMSRDTYDNLPNKGYPGRPVQYMFDKLVNPQIVVYPMPNDTFAHMEITRHRQIQDIGSLQDKIECPERWFEAIIWLLSQNLAFELPDVKSDRIELCTAMATKMLQEAEDGETDGSPIYIQPKISPYTR